MMVVVGAMSSMVGFHSFPDNLNKVWFTVVVGEKQSDDHTVYDNLKSLNFFFKIKKKLLCIL